MRKVAGLILLTALAAILLIGCSSPVQKAQKLMSEGKYEELVAQYANEPSCAGLITEAKEKIAEKMLADGKYDVILQMYPTTKAAIEAKNKLAEALFNAGKYQEVLDKYPGTPAADKAKQALDQAKNDQGSSAEPGKPGTGGDATKVAKAEAEFQKIMNVKVASMRKKALEDFVKNPAFAGTPAVKKAQQELSK